MWTVDVDRDGGTRNPLFRRKPVQPAGWVFRRRETALTDSQQWDMSSFLTFFFGLLPTVFLILAIIFVKHAWEPDRSFVSLKEKWGSPTNSSSQFLSLDYAAGPVPLQVHYRRGGGGGGSGGSNVNPPPPIVLIHGTSASLHTWEAWHSELESTTQMVISLDVIGFGLTGPSNDGNYTIQAYVSFVLQFLDAIEVKEFHIGGNSLGGNIAWEMAVAAPDRVKSLILVDAAGYSPNAASIPLGFKIAKMPVINRLMTFVLPRIIIASSVKNVYGDQNKVSESLIDRYFELTLRKGNRKALQQRFQQSDLGLRSHLIRRITAKTLILWGAKDKLILMSDAHRFASEITSSKLVVFEELGHVPQGGWHYSPSL